MPDPKPQRSRGAQPGNTNALVHGFYAKARLSVRDIELLAAAKANPDADGSELLDVLRMIMARQIEAGGYNLDEVTALANVILKACLARHRISGGDDKRDAQAALDAVLADVRAADSDR